MADQQDNKFGGKIAGGALILAALGAMVLITQHPTTGSPGHDSIAGEIISESALNSFVHGGMIAFVLVFYFAMAALSRRLGDHSSVHAAQLLFAAATIAMAGAALVSGFIVPGLADHYADGSQQEMFIAQLHLLGETNQALAKAGTIFYGAAIFFLSLRLVALSGLAGIAGFVGLVVGAMIAAGMLTGHLVLNVHGMGVVIFMMGGWFILVAFLLLMRGKV
jgi:hypothetical protein